MKQRKPNGMLQRILAIFALMAAMSSCSDFDSGHREDVGPSGGTAGEVTMAYSVDGMTYQTRAAETASAHETTLNHVHLIFCSTIDGKYITHVQAAVITNGAERKFSFAIPSEIKEATDYKLLVVGNGDSFIPLQSDGSTYDSYGDYLAEVCPGHTWQELKENLTFHSDKAMSAKGTPLLPMFGELINNARVEIPFRYDVRNNKYEVNGFFYFKRACARIDLYNLIPDKLVIEYVKVVNFIDGGYVFQDGKKYGSVVAGIDDVRPSDGAGGWMAVDLKLEGGKSQQLKQSLYALPNIVSSTASDDNSTTALMIAARYGTSDRITYYRFNLTPVGQPLGMMRNHIYAATIKNVTGVGENTQEDAMKLEKPALTAEVSDNWGDDTTIKTDEHGNYLVLSRTTVTFESAKDQSEIIQVKVNEGTSWELLIDHQTGDSNDKFDIQQIDAESFNIRCLEENTSYVLRKGYVKIVATTPQNTRLEAPLHILQLPDEDDQQILLVGGYEDTHTWEVDGMGEILKPIVQTGSMVEGWKVVEVDKDGNELTASPLNHLTNAFTTIEGSTYSSNGGDKGSLFIEIAANTSKEDRDMYLKVTRENVRVSDEGVPSVGSFIVHLHQPKTSRLLTLFPDPAGENGGFVLEGFQPNRIFNENSAMPVVLDNGISAQKEFFVSLSDPEHYTFTVTSSFDYYRDLRVSAHQRLPRNTQCTHPDAGHTKQTGDLALSNMTNGQKFYLNVFATGPGDQPISGNITVTAIPKDPDNYETQYITFEVTIVTHCDVEDVFLPYGKGWLLVADRNLGAMGRLNGVSFTPSKNYTTETNVLIDGEYNEQNQNISFSGETWPYFKERDADHYSDYNYSDFLSSNTATDAQWMWEQFTEKSLDDEELYSKFYTSAEKSLTYDKTWHVPNNGEWGYIIPYFRWSKRRAYLLSAHKTKKGGSERYIGCYMPSDLDYWSSNANDYWHAYYYNVRPDNGLEIKMPELCDGMTERGLATEKKYIRPVRVVTSDEFYYYQLQFLQ